MNEQQLLKDFQSSWAQNKYWVMAHSQQAYNEIRLMAKNNQWNQEKQLHYNDILTRLATVQPTEKTLRVTYQHIWGYFKKCATEKERHTYQQLLEMLPTSAQELEFFLKKLAQTYQVEYLLAMRWVGE